MAQVTLEPAGRSWTARRNGSEKVNLAHKILIPLLDTPDALPYLKLAAALLPEDGKILALKVVRVPEEASLSEGAEQAPDFRSALQTLEGRFPDQRVELRSLVRVSHRVSEGIAETIALEECDLLLLPWRNDPSSEERLFRNAIERLLEQPPCRLLVARRPDLCARLKILLAVRGGPYAEFALQTADRLTAALNAELTMLHCEEPLAPPGFTDQPYQNFLHRLHFYPGVRRRLTVQGDPRTAILEEAARHDLVIVGAAGRVESRRFGLGPIVEHLAAAMPTPLIVVKTPPSSKPHSYVEPLVKPKTLSERVDQWFAENTFHSREFSHLEKLVELKEKQGLSISVGLPSLNEAETIGNIIRILKRETMERVPLVDEIMVIDSRSTDDTAKIAEDLGVPIRVHQEILPQYGSYRGKGEALWKSLHVLRGDLILWIDTDIKNMTPGFVYGLLGPLLKDPEIQYVKGFYRRPLRMGEKIHASGGGRVTELTARPLLNLFFPELSGIIQPLSGEYGGRREILEQVPFFTGYGVETGLLIDIYNASGLRGIAQVDLEERIHRNQSLPALSQMAFAIIGVFIERLEERNRIHLLEEVNRSMKIVTRKRRTYVLEVRDIQDRERPPMITLPEYRSRR